LFRKLPEMPFASNLTHVSKTTSVYGQVLMDTTAYMADQSIENRDAVREGLCYLRQSLTCCACAGLLEDAMVSPVCGHHYCAPCQLSTPKLKILCRQCRERKNLIEENQLRIIVGCYKQICHILASGEPTQKLHNYKSTDIDKSTMSKMLETPAIGSSALQNVNIFVELVKEVTEGTELPRMILHQPVPSKFLARKASIGGIQMNASHRSVVSYKTSKEITVVSSNRNVKVKIETPASKQWDKVQSYKRKLNSRFTNSTKKPCTETVAKDDREGSI